jgi:hypothetical protein
MRARLRILACVLGFGFACSNDGDDASSPSTTTTTTTTTSGGDATDPTDATETMASTGGDEPTVGADCPQDETPTGPAVTFTLRNLRSEPIFVVSQVECAEGYVRVDLVGDPNGRWPIDGCAPTCADIVAGDCWDCGCEAPRLLRIAPGGSHEVIWDGRLWVPEAVPAECNACGVAPDCLLGISAPAETYLVTVTASTTAMGCDDPACACEGESCFVEGEPGNPIELPVQAQIDVPGTTALELDFD